MQVRDRARMLGFLAAANVHLTRHEKKPKNIEAVLLRHGHEVFCVTADSVPAMVAKVDALGKTVRQELCKRYRDARALPNPNNRHEGRPISVSRSEPPTEAQIRVFYETREWTRLSYDVKLERGRTCECCGAKAPEVRIHTDHIKPVRRHWDLRLERSNLQILCESCNRGKGSRDETDFR